MSSTTFDKLLVLLGPSLKFHYQNEKVHATRRKVSSDTKVKENLCLVFDTLFIHCSFVWKRFRNLEYSLFITILSIKDPKIQLINWIIHPICFGIGNFTHMSVVKKSLQ